LHLRCSMTKLHYKSFIKDNLVVLFGTALVYMQGFILMPVIIKTVGVTVYGGLALLTSLLGLTMAVSNFGAGFKSRRFMPSAKSMKIRRDLFYPPLLFQLFSILFSSALLIIFHDQLNTYFFKNEITYNPFLIPLYMVGMILYSQGTDFFKLTSRVHYMTAATLCFPYIHIVFILAYIYIYRSISINVLMVSKVVSAFLIAIPCFGVVFREIGIKFSFYRIKDLVADIKLGFPLLLGYISDFILAGCDRYFIAFYLSVTAVGYYAPGYALGSLIVFVPKAMGLVLPMLLSKAVDNEDEYDAQQMLNYALKIFILLAIPFVFGSIVLGRPILTLLANKEVAEKAIWVTPLVAAGALFYGLYIILSNVLFVRMKTAVLFKITLFGGLFNLLTNAILIYFFRNIIVAAITTLLSYFFSFLYITKTIKDEKWPVDFHLPVILKSLASSLFMSAILLGALSTNGEHLPIPMLALLLALSIICYFFGLLVLGTFTQKEIQFVKGFISK
jgi:O-antigen/teichoic acid export membrane protein